MKKKQRKGKFSAKKRIAITTILWWIASILLIIDLAFIGMIHVDRRNARSDFQQMAADVQAHRENPQATLPAPSTEVTHAVTITEPAEAVLQDTEPTEDPEVAGILAQYREMYKQNPEMIGWLRIDGTIIDYPVMHTPEDPEKYLHLSFDGDYSYPGVPFMDYRCAEDSDNLLIYGHNMSDETMFHTLVDYKQKSYWQAHPIIRFDSLYEEREFEVVAAFYDRVYYTHEKKFKFYNFIDAENEEDFNQTMKTLKSKSLYDTGITPQYGQQLIMLVTCTYQEENGRFVVLACEKRST